MKSEGHYDEGNDHQSNIVLPYNRFSQLVLGENLWKTASEIAFTGQIKASKSCLKTSFHETMTLKPNFFADGNVPSKTRIALFTFKL